MIRSSRDFRWTMTLCRSRRSGILQAAATPSNSIADDFIAVNFVSKFADYLKRIGNRSAMDVLA